MDAAGPPTWRSGPAGLRSTLNLTIRQCLCARRTAAAEAKISQAEGQAIAEVRARATDLAVMAAREILEKTVPGKVGDDLLSKSITEVKTRLN